MAEIAIDKSHELPIKAVQPAETPEAQEAREAAEKAKLEAGAKALAKNKVAEAVDTAKSEDPEKILKEELDALDALEITTNPEEITMTPGPDPATSPDSKKQEAAEGGVMDKGLQIAKEKMGDLGLALAATMEPFIDKMLTNTIHSLEKDGTGGMESGMRGFFLQMLIRINLYLNPKPSWAEDLSKNEKNQGILQKGFGMTLAKDDKGNYSCSFEAVLQPEALPCFPANELLSRYLGEDTLSSEFTRGQSIGDLKGALAGVPADSAEKAMADLMLKNITELGLDDKATLGAAFKAGFGPNLEDRLALLTGDEQTLVTSSLARHATEAKNAEASDGESTLKALKLGDGITLETPLTSDLLTKLSAVDATGNKGVQQVKMLSTALLMGGPGRTEEENASLLKATATDSEWKKAFDLKDDDVLTELTGKLKDLDATILKNGLLQDLLLASQDLISVSKKSAPIA